MKLRLAVLLALVFTCIQAQPRGQEHWVATWTTAQLLSRTAAQPPAARPADVRSFNNQKVNNL